MHTHKTLSNGSLATGCDAAKIVLEITPNGYMEFTFYMSPPVKHAWAVYERTGEPPSVLSYYIADLGDPCDPLNPKPPTLAGPFGDSMCPALSHSKLRSNSAT